MSLESIKSIVAHLWLSADHRSRPEQTRADGDKPDDDGPGPKAPAPSAGLKVPDYRRAA